MCLLRKSTLLRPVSLPIQRLQVEPRPQPPLPLGSDLVFRPVSDRVAPPVAGESRHLKQLHRQPPCFPETTQIPKHRGVFVGSAEPRMPMRRPEFSEVDEVERSSKMTQPTWQRGPAVRGALHGGPPVGHHSEGQVRDVGCLRTVRPALDEVGGVVWKARVWQRPSQWS